MTRLWMLFKVPFHYVSDLLPGHGNWDTSKMIPEITFSAEVFEYVPYSVRVSGTYPFERLGAGSAASRRDG